MDKKIKVLFFSFLIVSFGFFNVSCAKADTWGANFGAEGMGQMMDMIQEMIHGVIMGALKQAAVQTINDSVNNLISGTTTAGSMFISDWEGYLQIGPQRENALYMNDFFTMTTRGRASGLNYKKAACEYPENPFCCVPENNPHGNCFVPPKGGCSLSSQSVLHDMPCSKISECGENPKCCVPVNNAHGNCFAPTVTNGTEVCPPQSVYKDNPCSKISKCGGGEFDNYSENYSQYLTELAEKATTSMEIPQVDLEEYTCNAFNMFEDETWKAFDAFTGKTVNNPIGYTLIAQEVQQADLERRKKEAETKAIAYQGYKPQTKGDMVVTPGSTIKDVVSNVKDIPNKTLAAAKDMPEVITSIVTSILTKTIQQGIGNARGNIQREIDGKICNFSKGISGKLDGFSPEGSFDMPSFSRGSSSSSQYRGMNCNIR